jgi:hypothetical protein
VVWDPDAQINLDLARAQQRKKYVRRSRTLKEPTVLFRFRPRERVMISRQIQLAKKVVEKGRRTFRGIYYGGEGNEEGEGQCFPLSLSVALAIVRGEKGQPRKDWQELGFVGLNPDK